MRSILKTIPLLLLPSLLGCSDEGPDTNSFVQMFPPTSDMGLRTPDSQPLSLDSMTLDAGEMAADSEPRQDRDVQRPDAQAPDEPDASLRPDPMVNTGWIGGPCSMDSDCTYDEAFCLTEVDGYPRGLCSLDCERFCPDRDGMPVTFCIDDVVAGNGACVQRCDYNALGATGCRPGYHCETRQRFNESDVGRGVCVPGDSPMMGPGTGECFDELNALGVSYQRAAPISDAVDGAPHLMCRVDDNIQLLNPINGITFQYLQRDPSPMTMACDLALAIHQLTQLLAEYDIVAVGHIGTYNCRGIRSDDGSINQLSQHGLGRAIDLKWFRNSNGQTFDVEDHWEHGVTRNFRSAEGELLYELGQEMFRRGLFNIILTPEFNAAHDNHFHVDLTEGGRFIGTTGYGGGCGNEIHEH